MFNLRKGKRRWVFAGAVLAAGLVALPAARGEPAFEIDQRFREVDRNADGKVTSGELKQADLFQRLDADGNGEVTLDEARRVFPRQVKPATPEKKEPAAETTPAASTKTADATAEIRQGPRRLKAAEQRIGRLIPDLSFTDIDGRSHRLSEFKSSAALVVAVTSTSCPLSKRYLPTLAQLEQTTRDRNVSWVFVNPRATDSDESLREAIRSQNLKGPYVRDPEGKLLAALGATSTTDVFVLDRSRTLAYRGAVDDQYGFGYSIDAPREKLLSDALDAVLSGSSVPTPATEAPGCALDFEPAVPTTTGITYHNRISRLVQTHCVECHRAGGVAPFSLESPDDLVSHAAMICQVVERGTMPPWFAAPAKSKPSPWANDRSLPEADKAELLSWLASDKPLGDPADAPLPRTFPSEWQIGKPDAIYQIPQPIAVKATGTMPYQNAVVETGLTEDKWVRGLEVRPTDRSIVHHVLVFVQPGVGDDGPRDDVADERGGFFAAYVPGNNTFVYPAGFAKRLPKGSKLRFQLHYTPSGTATSDQTRLGLIFADEAPRHVVQVAGIVDPRLSIPPDASNHEESSSIRLPSDVRVMAFMPHMHLRGKAFRYELQAADGTSRTLLDIPRYDFNWQLLYRYTEPELFAKGDAIKVTGWFDNSSANPANPDPSQTVRWGQQTYDEMLIGYIEYYVPGVAPGEPGAKLGSPVGERIREELANRLPEGLFRLLDADNDAKLTRDEIKRLSERIPRLKDNPTLLDAAFTRLDANADGTLSVEEFKGLSKLGGGLR